MEDWKQTLNKNICVAAILNDSSKAFDCVPHDLLLIKLKVFGVSEGSCKLMTIYLGNRMQRVEIGENYFMVSNHQRGSTGPI